MDGTGYVSRHPLWSLGVCVCVPSLCDWTRHGSQPTWVVALQACEECAPGEFRDGCTLDQKDICLACPPDTFAEERCPLWPLSPSVLISCPGQHPQGCLFLYAPPNGLETRYQTPSALAPRAPVC